MTRSSNYENGVVKMFENTLNKKEPFTEREIAMMEPLIERYGKEIGECSPSDYNKIKYYDDCLTAINIRLMKLLAI